MKNMKNLQNEERRFFFKINGYRDILSFVDFTVPKIFLHNKIVNKTRTKKDNENFTHCFGAHYLAKSPR